MALPAASSLPWTRREWMALLGAGALSGQAGERLNILWISCEDINLHLGAFGDSYAVTPCIDAFARRSVRYSNCWSAAPVCAPARTSIISGVYPPSTGSEHMRSMAPLPPGMKMFPQFLREAGYYTSNNSKEDYNLVKPAGVWDDSSTRAHWRNRKPGQPFFSVFNLLITHESQIRTRPHRQVHDPARVRLPAYHPDLPEIRQDWAQYYDNISTMDGQFGSLLQQLEADRLSAGTIVWFFGDNGSGMPRSKRTAMNSGLNVPLAVHIPERWKHLAPSGYREGALSTRMLNFVDFAPAMLSTAGIRPPAYMQGHAFLGRYESAPPRYTFGFRGRMDERYDMVRSVRDERYVYVRNFMPHRLYGQHVAYMFETPSTLAWKRAYDAGAVTPAQKAFWETKPAEELYDLKSDPDEVRNLASSAAHRDIRKRFRTALREQILKTRDTGFLPEAELHTRPRGATPYELARDERRYPLRRILRIAERASSGEARYTAGLKRALADPESTVRYWAATGMLIRGDAGGLAPLLEDSSPSVRIVAAECLGRYGTAEDLDRALAVLIELAALDRNGLFVAILALNAVDQLGAKALPLRPRIERLPLKHASVDTRNGDYVQRLVESILGKLRS